MFSSPLVGPALQAVHTPHSSSAAGTPAPRPWPPRLVQHASSSPAIAPRPPAPSMSAPPLSSFWQQQLELLEISRHSSDMHHHARAAAAIARAVKAGEPLPVHVKANGLSTEHIVPITSLQNPEAASAPAHPAGSSSTIPSSDPAAISPAAAVAGTEERDSSSSSVPWTAIDLGGNGLRAIAPELWNYDFLTRLYINHNRLTTLPPDLYKLHSLEVLDASANQIVALPPELGTLSSLKEIFLFDNKLNTLPYELGMLYKLEFIGLAGNPLVPELAAEVRQHGSQSLIRLLRDQAPAPPAPAPRAWVTIEDQGDPVDKVEPMSVLTYNVLADNLASDARYGYTPSWALKWDYRKEKILADIIAHDTDVVCLQEVGLRQYDDFFLPALSERGYSGLYHAKSRVKTMSAEEKGRVDGCAVFYRAANWHLAHNTVIEYSQACLNRTDIGQSDDVFNRVMPQDQVGVVCCLESRTTGSKVLVANTHLCWDPAYSDVKTVQMAMLLDKTARVGKQFATQAVQADLPAGVTAPNYTSLVQVPTFICGDFNSDPDSAVVELLATGQLRADHPDFRKKVYGTLTTEGLQHSLVLASCYAQADGGARLSPRPGQEELLPFTNFTPDYTDVLDYIFFNRSATRVTALLGPIDPAARTNCVGFPNAYFPSDHIPIACRCLLQLPATKPSSPLTKGKAKA